LEKLPIFNISKRLNCYKFVRGRWKRRRRRRENGAP
jgi:hypothetical protein